jgi:uncharacterized damage-inducible protein DinB
MTVPKSAVSALHAAFHDCFEIILDHIAGVSPDVLTRELAGFGRPTVRDQIAHVLSTESAWVCGLQLMPIRRVDPRALTGIDRFREARDEIRGATIAYLGSISETRFNAELERYPEEWMGPRRTPAFILLHVVTHGFHHKGQIVSMLRLLDYPVPDTDMQRA